jgi:hypothetical protein
MAVASKATRQTPPRVIALTALLGLVIAGTAGAGEKTFVYALYGEPETLDSAKMESERALHPVWLICDALAGCGKTA